MHDGNCDKPNVYARACSVNASLTSYCKLAVSSESTVGLCTSFGQQSVYAWRLLYIYRPLHTCLCLYTYICQCMYVCYDGQLEVVRVLRSIWRVMCTYIQHV